MVAYRQWRLSFNLVPETRMWTQRATIQRQFLNLCRRYITASFLYYPESFFALMFRERILIVHIRLLYQTESFVGNTKVISIDLRNEDKLNIMSTIQVNFERSTLVCIAAGCICTPGNPTTAVHVCLFYIVYWTWLFYVLVASPNSAHPTSLGVPTYYW